MTTQRKHIRGKSGRTVGYLVNGRIIAAVDQYANAIRNLADETIEQK